jgi:hypothetical protein
MKYGEHLKNNIAPEYGAEPYLAYERLDQIITELMQTKPSRYVSIPSYNKPLIFTDSKLQLKSLPPSLLSHCNFCFFLLHVCVIPKRI